MDAMHGNEDAGQLVILVRARGEVDGAQSGGFSPSESDIWPENDDHSTCAYRIIAAIPLSLLQPGKAHFDGAGGVA